MYSSQLKVSLLSLSVLLAISTSDVMAAKLTIEQRLELLESELSANKKSYKKRNHNYRPIKVRWPNYKKY